MGNRKKIGIFIDYSLRTPSFTASYNLLKQYLFSEQSEAFELEGDFAIRDFWKEQIKDDTIADFYSKMSLPEDDYEIRDWRSKFYNEEHFKKFIEDYSFNLFVDAETPCKRDIEMMNIAQTHLFDVVLFDEYLSTRKKSNTFFYLSKVRIFPHSIVFLKEGEEVDANDYLGIWNPKTNSEHENKEGVGAFELWIKEMEIKVKECMK